MLKSSDPESIGLSVTLRSSWESKIENTKITLWVVLEMVGIEIGVFELRRVLKEMTRKGCFLESGRNLVQRKSNGSANMTPAKTLSNCRHVA